MNWALIIGLIILGLIYIISPYDAVPDFIPILGQADDLFILGVLLYYLWGGSLPSFLRRGSREASSSRTRSSRPGQSEAGEGDRDPYAVLGVSPGAGPEEIRAAFRQASQAYHPDKVAHLGPEFQELAQKKFIEIQRAYEILRERGGW